MTGFVIVAILIIGSILLMKHQKEKGEEKIDEYVVRQEQLSPTLSFSSAIVDVRNHAPDFAKESITGIEKIKTFLMNNEEVHSNGYARDDMKHVIYAVTNKRLLLCTIGVNSEQITSINYTKITNVDFTEKLNTLNYVTVESYDKSFELLIPDKDRAIELFNSIQQNI
ncbi:PH domain-containing protein [Paenibacillus taichungensis]